MGIMDDAYAEEEREREAARAATDGYTGEPCVNCGRIRVYLRRDGRYICEKCGMYQASPPLLPPEETRE